MLGNKQLSRTRIVNWWIVARLQTQQTKCSKNTGADDQLMDKVVKVQTCHLFIYFSKLYYLPKCSWPRSTVPFSGF